MSARNPIEPRAAALKLQKINSFLHCAEVTARKINTDGSGDVAELLLHVQNLIYDLRCAIDPRLEDDSDLHELAANSDAVTV